MDYDRFSFADKETQLKCFKDQLEVACTLDLPLFLHCRSAIDDFITTIKPFLNQLPRRGVLHSFTGTIEEADKILELGFLIGLNGCSIRDQNGIDVVKHLPLDKIMLESGKNPLMFISHYNPKLIQM